MKSFVDLHRKPDQTPEGRDRPVLESKIAATDRKIDHLVYELYDLTPDEIKIVEDHFKE